MNKFIKNIIAFSIKNKAFTFIWVGILAISGFISFKSMPIEAFPDVTNTQITIITQWNGRSAEEVERFVTTPIELGMSPVQKKTSIRSTTMFGLSIVKIIFDDGVDDTFARNQVNNLLRSVSLPDDVDPDVQPLTVLQERFSAILYTAINAIHATSLLYRHGSLTGRCGVSPA